MPMPSADSSIASKAGWVLRIFVERLVADQDRFTISRGMVLHRQASKTDLVIHKQGICLWRGREVRQYEECTENHITARSILSLEGYSVQALEPQPPPEMGVSKN